VPFLNETGRYHSLGLILSSSNSVTGMVSLWHQLSNTCTTNWTNSLDSWLTIINNIEFNVTADVTTVRAQCRVICRSEVSINQCQWAPVCCRLCTVHGRVTSQPLTEFYNIIITHPLCRCVISSSKHHKLLHLHSPEDCSQTDLSLWQVQRCETILHRLGANTFCRHLKAHFSPNRR